MQDLVSYLFVHLSIHLVERHYFGSQCTRGDWHNRGGGESVNGACDTPCHCPNNATALSLSASTGGKMRTLNLLWSLLWQKQIHTLYLVMPPKVKLRDANGVSFGRLTASQCFFGHGTREFPTILCWCVCVAGCGPSLHLPAVRECHQIVVPRTGRREWMWSHAGTDTARSRSKEPYGSLASVSLGTGHVQIITYGLDMEEGMAGSHLLGLRMVNCGKNSAGTWRCSSQKA